ncbi:MAG TPA: hypothetical protein VFT01_04285 [Homoserinimonas sp.]|nr:hypothetical protein [Homoserinimonas sp.]
MPTDAELRTLFHDASAPLATIDAATVIRRSKRRRLPQQLGAGSVVTLAVAGIGVASFTGLRGLAPMSASETTADGPVGISEGAPFVGGDSTMAEPPVVCDTNNPGDADLHTGLEVAPAFSATAQAGGTVIGTLSLINTGTEPLSGIAVAPTVTLARDGEILRYSDQSAAETKVDLAPGESTALDFSFAAVDCETPVGDPLEPGEYALSAALSLYPADGPARLVGGPASTITLR